jgi:uncharacterized protein (DUF488 family)
VRTSPTSGFAPQFNQDDLRQSLAANGIRYLFLGKELGGRPNGQHPTSLEEKMAVYRQVRATQDFKDGIARLKQGATKYIVAIMCSEEDPGSCHRHMLVAPALEEADLSVCHIRGHGRCVSEAALVLTHSEKTLRIMERQLSFLPPDQ